MATHLTEFYVGIKPKTQEHSRKLEIQALQEIIVSCVTYAGKEVTKHHNNSKDKKSKSTWHVNKDKYESSFLN